MPITRSRTHGRGDVDGRVAGHVARGSARGRGSPGICSVPYLRHGRPPEGVTGTRTTGIRRRSVVWSEIPRCWVGPVWFAWAGRRRRFNALKVIDSSSQAGCRQLQDRRTGGWPIPVRFLSRYRSQAVRVLDVPAQRTTPRWCDCNRVRAGRRHGASRGAVPVRCGALAKLEAGDIVRYYCACSNASLGSQ